jgi:putative tributyrin esterase
MAFFEIHLSESDSLAKATSAFAIVPELKQGPFPVLYLLHGLWDDYSGWMRKSSIERYVRDLPLIVIMPDGARSFYTDSPISPVAQYESYITKDLVTFVDSVFQTIPERRGRAIAGLSMGGYGALKLALKHPDIYCAANSHSGALAAVTAGPREGVITSEEFRVNFGDAPSGGPDDLFAIAERADRGTLPALRIDCGVDDHLIDSNRRFHSHLTELCVPHDYIEFPGIHDWLYWDTHVQEALVWICDQLGIKPAVQTIP